MENIKVLSADEAFKVTVKNRMTFDQLMETITGVSNNGNSSTTIHIEIADDAKDRLMDLGYMFGTTKDLIGNTFTRISWKQ